MKTACRAVVKASNDDAEEVAMECDVVHTKARKSALKAAKTMNDRYLELTQKASGKGKTNKRHRPMGCFG